VHGTEPLSPNGAFSTLPDFDNDALMSALTNISGLRGCRDWRLRPSPGGPGRGIDNRVYEGDRAAERLDGEFHLAEAGYTVHAACNGHEGLEQYV